MDEEQPKIEKTVMDTMIGPLVISGERDFICTIEFSNEHGDAEAAQTPTFPAVIKAVQQLKQYFSGGLRSFDLPMLLSGTDFQKQVWLIMQTIDYGQVVTYGDIARQLGNIGLSRAVGQAANRNPIPLVVPCHRVVGAGGALGGYAPGAALKKLLLEHEQQVLAELK